MKTKHTENQMKKIISKKNAKRIAKLQAELATLNLSLKKVVKEADSADKDYVKMDRETDREISRIQDACARECSAIERKYDSLEEEQNKKFHFAERRMEKTSDAQADLESKIDDLDQEIEDLKSDKCPHCNRSMPVRSVKGKGGGRKSHKDGKGGGKKRAKKRARLMVR
jgi:DNA repair exonuclease SbcCD ATPase subunit